MAYPDLSITYFVLRVGQAKPRGFHTQTIASLLSELPQELVRAAHYAASEIQSRLLGLAEEHARLLETWRKRQELFLQSHSFQVFLRDAEQRETWITTQEAFLSNEDAGVCVGIVWVDVLTVPRAFVCLVMLPSSGKPIKFPPAKQSLVPLPSVCYAEDYTYIFLRTFPCTCGSKHRTNLPMYLWLYVIMQFSITTQLRIVECRVRKLGVQMCTNYLSIDIEAQQSPV